MSIRAVLFDLDETLFDHSHSATRSMELLRAQYECLQSKSLDEIMAEYRRLLELLHIDVLTGRLTQDQARIDRMRGIFRFCGVDMDFEDAAAVAVLHRDCYRTTQRAIPGARELLEALRGRVKVGIVTNNLLEEQRVKLEVCGLSSFIDELITSEEYGCRKPDAEIFKIALDRLQCSKEEAVMVGDSWETDIIGARNAGIRPIWFNRAGATRPANESPVTEIASLVPHETVIRTICSRG